MTLLRHAVVGSPEWATASINGSGVGLRSAHINEVLEKRPCLPWFEVLVDNHTASGGLIPAQLSAIREQYPLTFHCVGMSLAGTDPLDWNYLATIKSMCTTYEPAWVSDHLCFTRFGEHHYHDLLPVPYTLETLEHVSHRIHQVQDYFGQRILVENVSSYLEFSASEMNEAEFLKALQDNTGCGLLLDINNVYVSACNHNFDPLIYLDSIPLSQVGEIHLAGYDDRGDYLLDAHNNAVSPAVWQLYEHIIRQIPDTPTLIEWDNDLPSLTTLLEEAERAETINTRGNTRAVTG